MAKIPEGQRHRRLLSMLGNMRKNGLGYDAALGAALAMNAGRFARAKTEAEIRTVVDDVFERYPDEASRPLIDPHQGWVSLSEIAPKTISYADRPILQWGAFHLLTGKGGSCKGTWIADFAKRLTLGELNGEVRPRRLLLISSEDDPAIDLVPRSLASGADISFISVQRRGRGIGKWFSIQDDADWLRESVEAFGDVGAIVIDPVSNHLGSADSNSETEIRDALAWLNEFAADHNLIVIGVRHLRKDSQGDSLSSVLGSTAWTDLPRAVLCMVRDDVDDMMFHMEITKGNRGPLSDAGRVYRLELVNDLFDGQEEAVTRVVFDPLEIPKSTSELLGPKSKTEKARRRLRELLSTDDAEANELKAQVVGEIGCSEGTVWRAFKVLQGEGAAGSRTDGFGDEKKTYWFLTPKADW